MNWRKKKKIIIIAALLSVIFSVGLAAAAKAVYTDNTNSGVTIDFSVPSICGNGVKEGSEACDDGNLISGDGCSNACVVEGGAPGCSGDCTNPVVAFISKTVNQTSAVIKWSATDNVAVASTYLNYGIGNYNTQAAGISLGNNEYQVSLSNLVANAIYSFQITATDTSGKTASAYSGTFATTNIPSDSPPVIANVASSTAQTTASVIWQASDDKGVASLSFAYGLTPAYGPAEPVAVSITGNYNKGLVGLLVETVYYFKITVTDNNNQTTTATGSFRTQAGDSTPPVISNVVVQPGITTSQITWDTNEAANSQVLYGLSNAYGGAGSDVNYVVSHTVLLNGLLPNTVYHYKVVSTDIAGNGASTADAVFTTQKDNTPPANVTALALNIVGGNAFKLGWTNPALVGDNADFAGVKILRKVGSASANIGDGTVVYTGGDNTFTDNNVSKNVNYFYTVFSFDTSANYSSGVSVNGIIVGEEPPVLTEICNDGIDNDNDGKIDCDDMDCGNDQSCQPAPVEICNDGIDNDNDGKIDCADSDCAGSAFCNIPSKQEICGNGVDDDGDGKIDCADSDCAGFAGCGNEPKGPNQPGGPGGSGYIPSIPTVPEIIKLKLEQVAFLAGNGKIVLSPQADRITGLAGSGLTVVVPQTVLASATAKLVLHLNGDSNQFVFNSAEQKYYANISFPAIGIYDAYLEIDYGQLGLDSLAFALRSLPFGSVAGENNLALAQAEVSLHRADGTMADLSGYSEVNPFFSNINGNYGWVVPNGAYYLIIKKDGYHERKTNTYNIANNTVNFDLSLIKKIPKLEEVIKSDATLAENTVNVVKNIAAKTVETTALVTQKVMDTAQVVSELADNPEVEQVSKTVLAPTAVSIVAVSTIPFLSFANLLPFLRLLFLQPLFLLGRRKREKWGQIYNGLNKLPIDLAIVRLINAGTNQVVQSKVTDKHGRYAFIAEPGKYRLEAQKTNFVFPSVLLSKFKNDGRRADIYHGEIVEVTEKDSVITANIPLDLAGAGEKPPARLLWNNLARGIQSTAAIAGFVVTLVSFYISPTWYIGALLGVHVGLSLLFRRLAKPMKAKGWGIVYDADSRKPIGKIIARLFNAELNKLVASQVTDRNGRYYFLAGDDKYFVTFEHNDYQPLKTDIIDLTDKEADTVAVDVNLRKNK